MENGMIRERERERDREAAMAEVQETEVKFVELAKQGRRIAYRQLGSGDKTLLVLHGLMSCRIAAMPGVKEETLREYGVKLVAIDRPGYGQSDPHPSETFQSAMNDIEQVIEALDPGKKVWLLGISMGGAFCWAAARFIPHRIAGIAMWSPAGNVFWKDISKKDRAAMLASYSLIERALASIAKWLPFFTFRLISKQLLAGLSKGASADTTKGLSAEDHKCLSRPEVGEQLRKDNTEALKYYRGFGVAKDLQLLHTNWGFQIKELEKVFKGEIHIWQGDRDKLVPLHMQLWIQRQLPNIVVLHELHGEGHLSWWCFNDAAHRETLATLFDAKS